MGTVLGVGCPAHHLDVAAAGEEDDTARTARPELVGDGQAEPVAVEGDRPVEIGRVDERAAVQDLHGASGRLPVLRDRRYLTADGSAAGYAPPATGVTGV